MDMEAYFIISPEIEKIEGAYSKCMLDPETGQPLRVYEAMVVVAPSEYPQLAEGLEIGALYREIQRPDGSSGFISPLDTLAEYYDWCEKLVRLVTNGKKLKERPNDEVEWSNKLSELVEDSEKYPDTEGRGPFWELLRYGLRGMTFGPVVCQKLVVDFQEWMSAASALGDSEFCKWYNHIRSTFALACEAGMVIYPWRWTEGTEPKLGLETLALFKSPDDHLDAADDIDDSDGGDDIDDHPRAG